VRATLFIFSEHAQISSSPIYFLTQSPPNFFSLQSGSFVDGAEKVPRARRQRQCGGLRLCGYLFPGGSQVAHYEVSRKAEAAHVDEEG
jgi:hypothetical protein